MKLNANEYECGVVDASEIMQYEQKEDSDLLREFRVGSHIYGECRYCGKYVKLTGFLARWHICNENNPRVRNKD